MPSISMIKRISARLLLIALALVQSASQVEFLNRFARTAAGVPQAFAGLAPRTSQAGASLSPS